MMSWCTLGLSVAVATVIAVSEGLMDGVGPADFAVRWLSSQRNFRK